MNTARRDGRVAPGGADFGRVARFFAAVREGFLARGADAFTVFVPRLATLGFALAVDADDFRAADFLPADAFFFGAELAIIPL